MAPKNRHRYRPVIVEATTEVEASMVSERQLADDLDPIGNDPEEEVNPCGSAAQRVGLDPKMSAEPLGPTGSSGSPQKDRQLDF